MPVRNTHIVLATLLCQLLGAAAAAEQSPAIMAQTPPVAAPAATPPAQDTAPPPAVLPDRPDVVFAEALRQSYGAPARVDLGDQATLRLADGAMFLPASIAGKVLLVTQRPVPPNLLGLLMDADGLTTSGVIRFVPVGFTGADRIMAWTPDDILASLQATVKRSNQLRLAQHLEPLEARGWVQPPHYDAQTHQLVWAALIVPVDAPSHTSEQVLYNAIAFGRDGFIQLTVPASLEKADQIVRFTASFLGGLTFNPEKTYTDVTPADLRSGDGLAMAIGLDALQTPHVTGTFLATDRMIAAVSGLVALIGALTLCFAISRHRRRRACRG